MSRSVLLVAALALFAACGGKEQPETPPAPATADSTATPPASTDTPAEEPSTITAEQLQPRFTFDAAAEDTPTKLIIEFPGAKPNWAVGAARPGRETRLTVTPTVPFDVQPHGTNSLAVVFPESLSPETDYRFVLESVATHTGTVQRPQAKDAWSTSFRTPALTLRSARVDSYALNGSAQLMLSFSGPVQSHLINNLLTVAVNDQRADAAYVSSNGPREITVDVRSKAIKENAKLRLTLAAGLALPKHRVNAKTLELTLPLNLLRIQYAHLQEGANGFFVEVNCASFKANGERYGGWDRGCEVPEGAEEFISTEPSVPVTVAPSRWGFRVFGEFPRGAFRLRIKQGLRATDGALLAGTFEQTFTRPPRQPKLSFTASGRYLPPSAWRNLGFTHVNVNAVEVTVRQVPPENLVFWMSNEQTDLADGRTSNLLVRKTLPVQAKEDTSATSWIDVGTLLPPTTKGVLQITLAGNGVSASSRLLLTEMSLVAKRMATSTPEKSEAVKVWALGIRDTLPLEGVEISAVKPSGQVLARCTTAAANGCVLELPKDPVDPASAFALIARKGEDLTYLRYSDLRVEISEADVSGEPYQSDKPYRVAVWTDRGVYRPGDTAHLTAVVRDGSDVAPKAGLPVEVTVMDPRQRLLRRNVLSTNAAGLVAMELPFEAFADTGSYSLRFAIAERQVASTSINVEEFVPERMKVTAKATGEGFALGEAVPIDVEANYLFGGSADGSPVELSCQLEQGRFEPAHNKDFTYEVWREEGKKAKPFTLGQARDTLDEKGQKRLSCPVAEGTVPFRGTAKLSAQVAVFEAGSGRSSQTQVRVPVHPARYYLGLKTSATKAETGKAFKVSGIVVDWQGNLLKDAVTTVDLEFMHLDSEYGYTWDEYDQTERYKRYFRAVREGRSSVQVKDGKFDFEVTPSSGSSGFLVKARSGNAATDLELEGEYPDYYYWDYYGEGGQVDMTPRPSRPTSLNVSVPQRVRVGESIQATIKVPYRGRILVTAETDRVLASEWREVEAGELKWEFTPKEFAPTVYVSALLVKDPHLESKEAFLPDRAFGVGSLMVEPTAYTHELKLTVPKEIRSGSTLEVELDVGPQTEPTFATVAAVDEGILQLTRFETPNPLAQIFTRRALGVTTFETLGWTLLMPPQGNSRSTGGDGESAAQGRVQPVKPVALWSGVVEIPASGKTKVKLEVPQFRGALRVMAVSVGPKKLGRAASEVKVRDPITISTTLPRFLIQNDVVQIPVFVTNLAGKPLDVTVSLTAEDLPVPGLAARGAVDVPLQLLGKSSGAVSLAEGKSGTLVFQARATKAVGAARLTVRAKGGGHESVETLDVPFSPNGPRERRVARVNLEQGANALAPSLTGWVPTTEKTSVWVTTNPYGQAFDHLAYLARYPYGCLEQTTSSSRPLLALGQLVDKLEPTVLADGSLADKVHSGVNRILGMQTPSGGFGYWPGSTESVTWASAYAVHFLIDAKKAKYTVPQDRIDDAITWLGRELDRVEGSGSGNGRAYWDTRMAEAYTHYVLAVAGKPRKAAIQQRLAALPPKEKWTGMNAEDAYLLKAALWLAGDRRYEADLKALDTSPIKPERDNGWSFYSDQRRRGLMLSVFGDLFGADPAGESLAQQLADQISRQRSGYYTTQELVWTLTGLGKRLGGTKGAEFSPPVLVAAGKKIEPRQKPDAKSAERNWTVARASEIPDLNVQVEKKGEGRLFAILSSEGVRQGGKWREGGAGLSITRTFRKLDGTELEPKGGSVGLADLVFVEVSVSNLTNGRVQNLAMVSRIPSGWEIENPRLGRGGEVSWVSPEQLWTPDYLAVKDDRLEVFGALEKGETKSVVFAVRAVTAGSFTLPPVEIEAMYDPNLWAAEAGGQTEVTGPWKDFLL